MEFFKLSNGTEMPAIGCGTSTFGRAESDRYESRLTGDYTIMEVAIDSGYRMFDTAIAYGNERGIGACLKNSGIPRQLYFLMGKIPNRPPYNDSPENIRRSVEKSLQNLQTDYFDMFLIHKAVDDAAARRGESMNLEKTLEIWFTLIELMEEGVLRGIGVSNFDADQLGIFLARCGQVPMVNEIRCNPAMPNTETVALCKERDILPVAHSPLSFSVAPGVFVADEACKRLLNEIGAPYGKSWAQVRLRYNYQCGIGSIPRSSKRKNLESNLDIFDFQLTSEEMATLQSLESGNSEKEGNPT